MYLVENITHYKIWQIPRILETCMDSKHGLCYKKEKKSQHAKPWPESLHAIVFFFGLAATIRIPIILPLFYLFLIESKSYFHQFRRFVLNTEKL